MPRHGWGSCSLCSCRMGRHARRCNGAGLSSFLSVGCSEPGAGIEVPEPSAEEKSPRPIARAATNRSSRSPDSGSNLSAVVGRFRNGLVQPLDSPGGPLRDRAQTAKYLLTFTISLFILSKGAGREAGVGLAGIVPGIRRMGACKCMTSQGDWIPDCKER